MSLIRRFKPAFAIYNLFKYQSLKHNLRMYKKYGVKKKYFSPVSSIDFKGLPDERPLLDRFNSRDELPKTDGFKEINDKWKQTLLDWSDNGYAILPGFFDEERSEKANREIQRLDSTGQANWRYGNKIMFAIHKSEHLRNMGQDPELTKILELLLGWEVKLFQSINFLKGSEQRSHSDSIHMTTFPFGNLIAVWVALEDINLDNGALHYYPGSHKLPYIMNPDYDNTGSGLFTGKKSYSSYEDKVEQVIEEHQLEKKVFTAKKGDILIWHANLLHGGEPMRNKALTRKSMVFHYYSTNAICYHEITQRPTLLKNW